MVCVVSVRHTPQICGSTITPVTVCKDYHLGNTSCKKECSISGIDDDDDDDGGGGRLVLCVVKQMDVSLLPTLLKVSHN